MSFWTILETVLLKPLQLLFEIIYMTAYDFIGDPGLTIIVLSLVMNFLVLPLYKRADAMQEEEQAMEKRLRKGVAHIKKTFSGDEKMMMLQTYYRQNNYKPTYVLRSAVSLFLEIPFFMAAYAFLSKLQLLEGVAFGPIADLGRPDGMLTVGGLSVNVLPFVMTAVNLVSCAIFTKGSTTSSKLQLYGMAIFFLIFLYDSPSGLVFYWTLNNVFSLVKTIFYKLKNPGRILAVMAFAAGLALLGCGLRYPHIKGKLLFSGLGLALMLPLVYALVKTKLNLTFAPGTPNKKIFFAGAVFLALLTGALIPSAVLNASPQEFVDLTYFHHPLWFVVSSLSMAFGTFVVWGGVFYWLASPSGKAVFDKAVWILCGVALVDYMFFGKDLGLLSAGLAFESGLNFTWKIQLLNLIVLAAISLLLFWIFKIGQKHVFQILLVGCAALGCMSALNAAKINASIQSIQVQSASAQQGDTRFTLSRSGQNVIVLMLDKAIGQYIPYLFNEKPELVEMYDGFTYYSNVISFGNYTNFGTPALFGGYEYTPAEMNRRSDLPLVEKHNEALTLMPRVFSENGFHATVADPPYANYQMVPDLSIYDPYPNVDAFNIKGLFLDEPAKLQRIQNNHRNFFCYSLMKVIPLGFQEMVYDDGNYCQGDLQSTYTIQTRKNSWISYGIDSLFMQSYLIFPELPSITKIEDNGPNQFIMMDNEAAHEPMFLQKPDYTPAQHVDNTPFVGDSDQYVVNGRRLYMDTVDQNMYYQTNMAVLLELGKWFDFMREQGVYDNTRIILVADHGKSLNQIDDLILPDGRDVAAFYPLLMVKDFGSTGFTTSDKFMTNGDVPTLAMDGLIENPINPFTGNPINSNEKTAHPQYVASSSPSDIYTDAGYTYRPVKWYAVHDNIWDKDNWEVVAESAILPDAG